MQTDKHSSYCKLFSDCRMHPIYIPFVLFIAERNDVTFLAFLWNWILFSLWCSLGLQLKGSYHHHQNQAWVCSSSSPHNEMLGELSEADAYFSFSLMCPIYPFLFKNRLAAWTRHIQGWSPCYIIFGISLKSPAWHETQYTWSGKSNHLFYKKITFRLDQIIPFTMEQYAKSNEI